MLNTNSIGREIAIIKESKKYIVNNITFYIYNLVLFINNIKN